MQCSRIYMYYFIHQNDCERYHYPHITEPVILELERAFQVGLNKLTWGMNSLYDIPKQGVSYPILK